MPAVADRVAARSRRVNEQRCEALHPPVHGDVVDLDPARGQELLDVAVREPEPQVPTHRQNDDLGWGAEALEAELATGTGRVCNRSIPHCFRRTPASPNAT